MEKEFALDGGISIRAMRFTLYVLSNDPKILYAPNGTQADSVVAKVGTFVVYLGNLKQVFNII